MEVANLKEQKSQEEALLNINKIIGRKEGLFNPDILARQSDLEASVSGSGFLVIGGAGSIGQAVVSEIFARNPRVLHVVDISENNLVELVRVLRSTQGYIKGDFQTFALDVGSKEFESMFKHNGARYDYILNLSALKHVRSESDPYTLMRLIKTNVLNVIESARKAKTYGVGKYFCVSTDKAANPVNMMGASKRIMELFAHRESENIPISMARFANVAFSDGSLLHGFNQRLMKGQPISAPSDVKRYFVTPQESGELCLLSAIYGENLDIFFPKLSEKLHLSRFSDIAEQFLNQHGYEAVVCSSEQEARERVGTFRAKGQWPCYFFESDTTGEKGFEEFFTSKEQLDWERFQTVGVIRNKVHYDEDALLAFEHGIAELLLRGDWSKADLLNLFKIVLPEFEHVEKGKYLDQRM